MIAVLAAANGHLADDQIPMFGKPGVDILGPFAAHFMGQIYRLRFNP